MLRFGIEFTPSPVQQSIATLCIKKQVLQLLIECTTKQKVTELSKFPSQIPSLSYMIVFYLLIVNYKTRHRHNF